MNWKTLNLITIFFSFFSTLRSQPVITVSAQSPKIIEISDLLELPATALANESVKITSVVSEKIEKNSF